MNWMSVSIRGPRISETPSGTYWCGQRANHSLMTHLSKWIGTSCVTSNTGHNTFMTQILYLGFSCYECKCEQYFPTNIMWMAMAWHVWNTATQCTTLAWLWKSWQLVSANFLVHAFSGWLTFRFHPTLFLVAQSDISLYDLVRNWRQGNVVNHKLIVGRNIDTSFPTSGHSLITNKNTKSLHIRGSNFVAIASARNVIVRSGARPATGAVLATELDICFIVSLLMILNVSSLIIC